MTAYADSVEFVLEGVRMIADPSGALYIPAFRALAAADLHLEKGSFFARRGVMLPPYDTRATLNRLAAAIARWRPRLVAALGDSFHDSDGPERLSPQDRALLTSLQTNRVWIWIAGNHDARLSLKEGERLLDLRLGPLTLRHEPEEGSARGEIAGHLHPVAALGGRRRAFVTDGARLLMPAFGAYAGGLNLQAAPIRRLFAGRRIACVLGRDEAGRQRVYAVCASRCAGGL